MYGVPGTIPYPIIVVKSVWCPGNHAGTVSVGLIPCPSDHLPALGDTVTFREATFEHFSTPILVPQGSSVAATLTSVYDQRRIP